MSKLRTRGKKAQDVSPPVKKTRLVSAMASLTRTIHQQVSSNSDQTGMVSVTMAQQLKRPAKNNKIPSSSSTSVGVSTSCSPGLPVQPTGAQNPSFPSPTPGMGQPMAQPPTAWWGPWGSLPPWASFNPNSQSFFNYWQQPGPGSYPWAQQQQQPSQVSSTPSVQQQVSQQPTSLGTPSPNLLPTAVYQDSSDNASSNGTPVKQDDVADPLYQCLVSFSSTRY